MSSGQQQSPAPVAASLPPSAKRKKPVLYEVGPVEGRDKWYLDSETADIHFVIGSDESSTTARIPAHKTLLARDSDVFKAMFYGPMKESGDIRLTDVSEAAFKEFLQFFYLTEVELTVENLADVMHLGHKYNVVNCVDVCIKFFKDVHDAGNILIGLGFGILYEHSELVTFCERFIVRYTNAVLKSNGLLECDRQTLVHILNANLFVCSEVDLFDACMKWVKAKSGHDVLTKEVVDEYLGEVFYNIRFGTMTIEEFCNLSQQYGSVLSSDFQAITKLIGLPHVQHDRFNTQSRQIKWNEPAGVVVECDREVNSEFGEWIQADSTAINFSSNKRLLLTGFTINRITDVDDDNGDENGLSIKIKITNVIGWSTDVVLKMNTKLRFNEKKRIALPRPIFTIPGLHYSFCTISIKLPRSFSYHSKELKEEIELDSDTIIRFRSCKKVSNDSKVVGIISALEFNRV